MTSPPCPHFGTCGGCATQDIDYAEEIRRKSHTLSGQIGTSVKVNPSENEFHYRSRMDFTFAAGAPALHARGDWKRLVPIEKCLLMSERAVGALAGVKDLVGRLAIPPYSPRSNEGTLRYLVVRESPARGGLMLVFLTSPRGTERIPELLDQAAPLADSVAWTVTDRCADVSFGDVREVRGPGWIEEDIGNLRLRFGPNSFFQASPWMTERLYRHVAERVSGRTTDLYCGVGGISLFAAGSAPEIIGLDNNPEAIGYADANAKLNSVTNCRFYVGEARLFLDNHRCDTLILDPPRSGLGAKIVRKVVRAGPTRVIYVSCNPKALAQELPGFEGYKLADIEAFDLFPKTPHVEVVVTLDRQ